MLKLTMDKAFPVPENYREYSKTTPFPFLHYPNDQILWKKIARYQ
jgi:hypothetical protein